MFYAAVSLVAAGVAVWVSALFVRAWPERGSTAIESRRSWLGGLALLVVGVVFYVVGAINPPGADLGEDLQLGAVVDSLGGGFAATGYAVAAMLVAFLFLASVDPARAGYLLVRTGVAAVPFLAVLTVLTILFDRDLWREDNIGPLMGGLVFFSLPACAAGALLLRATSTPVAARPVRHMRSNA